MSRLVLPLIAALLLGACSSPEPTQLQGQGKVTVPTQPAADTAAVDPLDVQTAPVPLTPEQRRALLEARRDALPRLNTHSPEAMVTVLRAWEPELRPEVMSAVRLGLMTLPIQLQERMVNAAKASGRTPQLSDQELFRRAYGEADGMRYDEFITHTAPLVERYQEILQSPQVVTQPLQAQAQGAQ